MKEDHTEKHRYPTRLAGDLEAVWLYKVKVQPDGGRRFTYVSENIKKTNGITAEAVLKDPMALYSQVHPDHVEPLAQAEAAAIQKMTTFQYETIFCLPDGSEKWVLVISNPFEMPDGGIIWDGIVIDISGRKATEQALKESIRDQQKTAEMLRLVMDTIPQSIFWKNLDSVYMGCNENFARVAGVGSPEEIVGKTDHDLTWTKEEAELFRNGDRRVMEENQAELNIIEPRQQRDGKQTWLNISKAPLHDELGNVVGILGTYENITEMRRMQEVVAQSEKMHSIGGLAAGMAHEINNPLSGILQNAQLLHDRLFAPLPKNEAAAQARGIQLKDIVGYMKDRRIDDVVASIVASGNRAAATVRDMLSFARTDNGNKEEFSVPDLIDKALDLASKDYSAVSNRDFRKIRIERKDVPPLPPVMCAEGKIQQVLLNILKNGAEAMWEKEYSDGTMPQFKIGAHADGDSVIIEIEDNGPGLNKDIQRRIFEPFFTTKSPGKGTGLGLSVSYFIITEEHGGQLTVDSWPGGTRFRIVLPL